MEGQIRTWAKRDENLEDPIIVLSDDILEVTESSTIDRLALILQLREMQEPDDRYALHAV